MDEPFVDVAASYAERDPAARLVLLHDGIYAASKVSSLVTTYVLHDDVSRRGLAGRLPREVRVISYDGLVELIEQEKVINFL